MGWLLWNLLIGLVCGYLGSKIMGTASDWVKDIILGVVGSIVGGLLSSILVNGSLTIIGRLLFGVIGACLVIWLVNKYAKK